MKLSLIICTYQRPEPLKNLLHSVLKQTVYPDEIIIVDGSHDDKTREMLQKNVFPKLKYFKVPDKHRGLTRQRNYGIQRVGKDMDIVAFLDDDTVLKNDYFEKLLDAYKYYPQAGGVGGYIINENTWKKLSPDTEAGKYDFALDGYVRKLPLRFRIRKMFHLLPDKPPGFMPEFSHGYSIGFLPPSGKIYPVEFFMGGVSSFKKEVVDTNKFSEYFIGYGLYEDMDYCVRVSRKYSLYVHTGAQLFHYHDEGGRPNKFKYGVMVVRNGWYVWRQRYPNPRLKAQLKWHAITLLLAFIRLINVINTSKKQESFTEFVGRIWGWLSLIWDRPI